MPHYRMFDMDVQTRFRPSVTLFLSFLFMSGRRGGWEAWKLGIHAYMFQKIFLSGFNFRVAQEVSHHDFWWLTSKPRHA